MWFRGAAALGIVGWWMEALRLDCVGAEVECAFCLGGVETGKVL